MDVESDTIIIDACPPELLAKLHPQEPLIDGQWVYYMPKTRQYVLRMLLAEWKARGGKGWPSRPKGLGRNEGARRLIAAYNRREEKAQTVLA